MQTGAVVTAEATIDRRKKAFRRWVPYGLLTIGLVLSVATAKLITPARPQQIAIAIGVGAALALQLWWGDRTERGPSRHSHAYFVVRYLLGFALTAVNPFFSFFAVAGYFDTEELIAGRRRRRVALFACSIPVAGAQTAGIPVTAGMRWIVFVVLLAANNVMLTLVTHFAEQEEQRSRERAATILELQQAHDENAALQAQLLVQAREAGIADERRRLAAEIHDTIAQGLTGIIAQLQAITGERATTQEYLDRATDLARYSLGEARRSVQNLAPAGLSNDGLPDVIQRTVDQWADRTGVAAQFTRTGTAQHLHGEVSGTLLRITQEALANVSKHASATRVGVTLSFMDDEVTLDIRDDGKGFDPMTLPARTGTGGFGLDGMRARAERIAGSLTIEAEPGLGTAVSARVPLVLYER
ncbi:sensor histidine kinase [Kribbella sp. NPDC026611]|uniref:sensor histidine kinase n=1 Tax=Kribbella sp. NPDC026611 TaxID=3154911 RepID=UPI00340B2325